MPKRLTGNSLRAARRLLVAEHGAVCHLCGGEIDLSLSGMDDAGLTVDHVVPLARGGANTLANMRPAHLACNRWKSDKLPTEMTTQAEPTSRVW